MLVVRIVLAWIQTESDLFDIVYPRCGIEEVQRKIDDQIPKLMASLVPVGPDLSRGQMSILFYEKRVSKAFFGMSTSVEKVNWEQWQIRLIVNTQPRDEVKTESAGTFRRGFGYINVHATECVPAGCGPGLGAGCGSGDRSAVCSLHVTSTCRLWLRWVSCPAGSVAQPSHGNESKRRWKPVFARV